MPRFWELYSNQRYNNHVQRSTMANPTESRRKAKVIMLDHIVYYLSEIPSQTYLVPNLASLTKRGHDIRFLLKDSVTNSLFSIGNKIIKQLTIICCQCL